MGSDDDGIRIMVVDDHRIVRSGLLAYFELIDDIEVVAEAENGREALDRLAQLDVGPGLPDVVLMDLLMPELGGIEATAQIKRRWPAVEVVALTSVVEEPTVRAVLESGASGYLLKDADAPEVAQAVRDALHGRMHLDATVARLLADSVRKPRTIDSLTPREHEVLGLIAEGCSNKAIASRLVVSERTARTHVSAVLMKLGLSSRTQAALWAVREGIGPNPQGPQHP